MKFDFVKTEKEKGVNKKGESIITGEWKYWFYNGVRIAIERTK